MFRQGVSAVLTKAGLTVDTPDDPMAWVRQVRDGIMLLTLQVEHDWHVLAQLRWEESQPRIIALVDNDLDAPAVRAVLFGARSVINRDAQADTLRRAVEITMDGQALIPADTLTALVASAGTGPLQRPITEEKVGWLRGLASGLTVSQLAERSGYSERAMFRLLRSLYVELGATGRTEALMYALQRGWLGDRVRR
jgi:DNA-binding NarL/FixJ family response regulator